MRLNHDRIIFLNCGLGRDSLTMLCLLCEGRLRSEHLGAITPDDVDAVVFSDTGCEWPHTYALRERVAQICEAHGLRFVVLAKGTSAPQPAAPSWRWHDIVGKASGGGYHRRPPIMADFQSRATVASLGKGDCTDNHKIQPIRRLINDVTILRFGINNRSWAARCKKGERRKHVTLIGYAADEKRRLDNGAGRTPGYVTEAYPLIDMGITKADEDAVLAGWHLAHVRKSGCYMCPYQPASWWWVLSVTEPELYARALEYERVALARNPRMPATGFKLKGRRLTIPEVVARWREHNPLATVDGVLAKTYTRCTAEARAAQRQELVQLRMKGAA